MQFSKLCYFFLVLTIGSIPFESFDIGGNISAVRLFFIVTIICALFSKNLLPHKLNRIEKMLIVFFGWALCTAYWSKNPENTLFKVLMIAQSLTLVFILINTITSYYRLKVILIAWIIGSFIISYLSITEYRQATLVTDEELYRVSGFGNPNENSFILCYAVLFAIYLDHTKFRFWSLGSILLGLYAVMANGSRMGMIIFGIVILGFIISLIQSGKKKYATLLIPAFIFIGISIFQTLPEASVMRLLNIAENIENQQFAAREDIWDKAFKVLSTHEYYNIIGSGWGSFQDIMPLVHGRRYAAHNFYLDVYMTTGIIGLSIILLYFYTLYKYIRRTPKVNIINYLFLIIPLLSMFSTNWSDRKWWYIMGALIYIIYSLNKKCSIPTLTDR